MGIIVTLDEVLAKQRRTGRDIAAEVGLSETQMSLFRSSKIKGIRFSTLARLCAALGCRPGDLLDYRPDHPEGTPDEPGELESR